MGYEYQEEVKALDHVMSEISGAHLQVNWGAKILELPGGLPGEYFIAPPARGPIRNILLAEDSTFPTIAIAANLRAGDRRTIVEIVSSGCI